MTEDPIEGIKLYWAENKLCFSDFNLHQALQEMSNPEIMILKDISLRPEAGFVHLAKVELLVKAFPNDGLLSEIYQQLLKKCNDIVINVSIDNYRNIMQRCFSDEPTTYMDESSARLKYDVNNNKYLKEIIADHPELEGAINGVIYL